jgi:thiamine biosynthesis lipoprotein
MVRASGRAMGTRVAVNVIDGPEGAPAAALRRLEALEARWSRFRPDSDLRRASDRPGRWTTVAPETLSLLAVARTAWEATAGACDLTGGAAIAAAGYDRTLEDVIARGTIPPSDDRPGAPRPFPGLDAVEVDAGRGLVRVARGCILDAGAIGKGFAADLVADEVRASGARGVLVDVGGDLAVRGEPPEGGPWRLGVDLDGGPSPTWTLASGGVATSSSVRRRWRHAGREMHHVLDPRTGAPVVTPPRAVSVLAGTAWWAEAVATALMVAAPSARASAASRMGAIAILVEQDGGRHLFGDVEGRLDGETT